MQAHAAQHTGAAVSCAEALIAPVCGGLNRIKALLRLYHDEGSCCSAHRSLSPFSLCRHYSGSIQALLSLSEGRIQHTGVRRLFHQHGADPVAVAQGGLPVLSLQPPLRHFSASIKAHSTSIKALFSLYSASIQVVSRLYAGSMQALFRLCSASIQAMRNSYFYNYSQAWLLVTRFIKALFMKALFTPYY